MKKILSLLLALIMCLTVLTSCDVQGLLDQFKDIIGGEKPPVEEYHIDKAESFLKNMYKDVSPVTGADYEVVGQVRVAGVAYTVTWTSDCDQVKIVALENGNYLVDLNEKATEDTPYTLTATITAGNGDTATVVYNRTIPKYNVLSWADYMAAAKGDTVLVEGIVVAMNAKSLGNSRNHLFLADASGKGGYYSYQMDQDPVEAGVKVGMTVSVSGPIEPYSGMQEIKGGAFAIVDETIKTVDVVDITEYILAGNTDFSEFVALPVTIKGVTIGSQDLATASSQYLYFSIAGINSYVRTYVTDFPTTLDAATATADNADKAAIDKAHADHFGYTADVTGILILYSGNPYLIPMSTDCFTNFKFVEKTAEEKVDAELAELKLEATVTSSTVVDVLTVGKYYDDVTISWTSDSEYAVVDGNKITLTVPTAGATAKITVTVTCGDVTKTKEFTVKLSMAPTAIADILAIGAAKEHNTYTEEKYIAAGVITEVYNTTYGNMKITDEHGNILTIYGTYGADGAQRYDALESKPVAGDYVVVLGIVGQYNGTVQIKNGWILTFTTPTSIEDANTIAGTLEDKGPTTEDKYLITGKVVEVANTKYGNLYIEDEAGNKIYVYGCYDQAGNRYDAMVTAGHAPVVGDTITVLSVIGLYNTAQLKNATVVVRVAGTTEEPAHECANVCETCQKCTNASCTETACAEKCEGHQVVETPTTGVVDPVVGTAYKFGMVQGKLNDGKVYYLKGGMSGYYMATTTNYAEAIDVYLETAEGGYYLYAMVAGVKTYINCVVSGTHVNGAYEAAASTVYTYDAESKTLIANVDGTPYWFGTRNDKTYTTVGPCAVSYAGFYCQFYAGEPEVVEPAHACDHACATCGKCTDADCTEEVCASKCEGHTTTPVDPAPSTGNTVTFDLGANGDAAHKDGSPDTTEDATYTETVGNYTLTVTSSAKMYNGATDAAGNSCLKLGTSSKAGNLSFTVGEDVTSVVIYVAKYKANASTVNINGTDYTLTKNSNDGEYDAITIDTTTVKTIELTTVSGGYRAMVNTIVFVIGE